MVVRMVLYLLARGANHVLWSTHIAGLGFRTIYSRMGLRRDNALTASAAEAFRMAEDALPKPSWYTFQRLSRLLSLTASVELVYSADHVVLIRLTARSRGFPADFSAVGWTLGSFRYAFVPWVDQLSEHPWVKMRLYAKAGRWGRIPLVPRVAAEPSGTLTRAGYPEPIGGPDWGDADSANLFRFGRATQVVAARTNGIDVYLWRTMTSNPELGRENVGLVAWLTDDSHWQVEE
jgi:hypothetical protein